MVELVSFLQPDRISTKFFLDCVDVNSENIVQLVLVTAIMAYMTHNTAVKVLMG